MFLIKESGVRSPLYIVKILIFVVTLSFSMLTAACNGDTSEPFPVRVLAITMFGAETSPWLEHESLPITIHVPNAVNSLRCATKGMCVATIGEGKSNAVASMSALLDDPGLNLSNAYFLTAGIAGTPPSNGTLGFAAWARWVVDWDLGHHVQRGSAPDIPYDYLPYDDQHTNVFHLNEKLVDKAFELTKGLALSDSTEAVENRSHYPSQVGRKPFTAICDTVTGDDYWAGSELSQAAQYVTGIWTKNQGKYCTSQMEDSGTATALSRHGYLNRYLNLRTASDFDQPYPGQTMQNLLSKFPGAQPAIGNAYLVASTVAHYLLDHPQ
jgi:purine nucleoside permease